VPERLTSPQLAVHDAARAVRIALEQRRTVLLNMPLDVQQAEYPLVPGPVEQRRAPTLPAPAPEAVEELVGALVNAERPVFIAGRGARRARVSLERLAEQCGGAAGDLGGGPRAVQRQPVEPRRERRVSRPRWRPS